MSAGMGRTRLVVYGLALLTVGCGTFRTPADAYFKKTKSGANVYVAPVPSAITRVAIMPFNAATELVGASVSDMFVTELMRTRRYTLIERGQIGLVLSETELVMSGLSDSDAIAVGRMMDAEGVILGTVDEYGTVARRGRTYPVVGASIRLIDCNSGRVMWSVGHARQSADRSSVLPEHARRVVHEMVAGLYQNWRVQRQVPPPRSAVGGVSSARAAESRPPALPPPPPGGIRASDQELREVTLTWIPPPDAAMRYRIERAGGPGGPFTQIAVVRAASGSYVDRTGLGDGGVYYYRLLAETPDGMVSAPSAPIESMTAPPPDSPDIVTVETPAGRAVRLSWKTSECPGVTRYVIERADGDGGDFVKVGESDGTVFLEGGNAASPLRDATAYRYRVRSVNRVGAVGEPSIPVEAVTRPPPAPVSGLVAVSDAVRCVPLVWQVGAEPDVVRYDIYRADGADGPYILIESVAGRETTRFLDGGRNPGKLEDERTYYYRIRAVNAVTAASDESLTVHATTRPPPPVVEGVSALSGQPRKTTLRWRASRDEKVTGYEIARSEPDGDFSPVGRTEGLDAVEYVDRGSLTGRGRRAEFMALLDGTEYRYRVRAFNAAGALSAWSGEVRAVTKHVPARPDNVKTSSNLPGRVEVSWSPNPEEDIETYALSVSDTDGGRFREQGRVLAKANDGPRFVFEGLRPGITLHVRVRAIDRDGLESPWSEAVAGYTKPNPDPPTEVTVEWKAGGAHVSWRPPEQSDVKLYRIMTHRRLRSPVELLTVEATHVTLSAVDIGRRMMMMVTAIDADGLESHPSDALEIRPPP